MGGWLEIWRVKLILTQVLVIVEVGVELGKNKTWCLMSNSSYKVNLSPCKIRKLQVQKLSFLPPKIGFHQSAFMVQNFLGPKEFGIKKIFGPKKLWL